MVWRADLGQHHRERAGLFAPVLDGDQYPAAEFSHHAAERSADSSSTSLGHNLVIVVLVFLIYPEHLSPMMWLALPGLAIVAINLIALTQIVGLLGAHTVISIR